MKCPSVPAIKGIPLGLEPGKRDFQEGMQQVRGTQLGDGPTVWEASVSFP